MNEKKCTKCELFFPATIEHFYKNPRGKDGLQSRCKGCQKAQVAEKWKRNPEYFNNWAAERRKRIGPEADNARSNQSTLKSKAKATACVYLITNKTTGRVYVGETIWKHRRWTQHKHSLSKGEHECKLLQEDYNQHGKDNFEYSVYKIIENKDKKKLRDEEEEAIRFLIAEGKQIYNKNRRRINGQRQRVSSNQLDETKEDQERYNNDDGRNAKG